MARDKLNVPYIKAMFWGGGHTDSLLSVYSFPSNILVHYRTHSHAYVAGSKSFNGAQE